jgi:uncharacterized protein YndB with AHSA1/START domain
MTDAKTETKTLVIERKFSHPPEKIWRAITQGPLIEAWLLPNDFQPVVGHTFTLKSPTGPGWDGIITCRVLAVEAPKRLSYTWGAMGMESVVTMTLTPTPGGTTVRMEQSGFPDDKGPNYRGATFGWTRFLENLDRVVGGLS